MRLKTLSPIHVGCGENYTALDFCAADGQVLLLDGESIVAELMRYGADAIKSIATGRKRVEDYIDPEEYCVRRLKLVGQVENREIRRHIHTINGLYIPGSSIKGSIRTAVLWSMVNENRGLLNFAISLMEKATKRKRITRDVLKKLDDNLENRVFREGESKATKDFMKGLIVGDCGFFTGAVYQIHVLGTNISVAAECIEPNQMNEFELKFKGVDEELIRESCRNFYRRVAEVELEYGYPDEKTRRFFKSVMGKAFPLRVGFGSGWYSTTIGTLLREHPKFEHLRRKLGLGKNPRSRKLSRNFPATRRVTADSYPLGWMEVDG